MRYFLLLVFTFPGLALFAQHSVVQHGKEWVCPRPQEETTPAQPVEINEDFCITTYGIFQYDHPNGTGFTGDLAYFNPYFKAEGYRFRIFDRWGELLFETTDPEKKWDGYPQGKEKFPLHEGTTCVYMLEFVDKDGVKKKHVGHFYVMGFWCSG